MIYIGDANDPATILADSNFFYDHYFANLDDVGEINAATPDHSVVDWERGRRISALVQMYDLVAPLDPATGGPIPRTPCAALPSRCSPNGTITARLPRRSVSRARDGRMGRDHGRPRREMEHRSRHRGPLYLRDGRLRAPRRRPSGAVRRLQGRRDPLHHGGDGDVPGVPTRAPPRRGRPGGVLHHPMEVRDDPPMQRQFFLRGLPQRRRASRSPTTRTCR